LKLDEYEVYKWQQWRKLMPYKSTADLPDKIKSHLPKHAAEIYLRAFNHAYEEYKDPKKRRDPHEGGEQVAHKVAWAAVEKKYKKGASGQWEEK
jgi:cation transport regulator